jgi:tetratricopeptide (TPR) repeat protein
MVSGVPQGMLGSAFTQELAARLRTIKALRVVSPLSPVNAADVGARLGVETVLSGAVDFSGSGLRVTAQLADAKDGTVLWAEQAADLDGKDVPAAQARLASAIAARLRGTLLPGENGRVERRGSANAEAYHAFLLGRAETLRIDNANAPVKAAMHFETAVRLDPGFADAWAGLARARQVQFFRGTAPRAILTEAIDNARQALAIDPENLVARDALVRIYHSTGQNEDALEEAKRALAINPEDPYAQAAAGLAYFRTGMLDRAIDSYERYLAAYPDDEDAAYQLVHACLFARQYERGIRHAQPLLAVQRLSFPTLLLYANSGDPGRAVALARQSIASRPAGTPEAYFAGQVLDRAGLHAEARAAWTDAAEDTKRRLAKIDNERSRMFLALIYSRLNRPQAAHAQIARALALNPGDPWILFFASETYALLDDRAAAFDALRRSVASGFLGLHYLDYYQQAPNGWSGYRNDPEFVAIRSGLDRKIVELRARY